MLVVLKANKHWLPFAFLYDSFPVLWNLLCNRYLCKAKPILLLLRVLYYTAGIWQTDSCSRLITDSKHWGISVQLSKEMPDLSYDSTLHTVLLPMVETRNSHLKNVALFSVKCRLKTLSVTFTQRLHSEFPLEFRGRRAFISLDKLLYF